MNALSAWTTMTYESFIASSSDKSLNLDTGSFTAPIEGSYFFHAHAGRYPGGYGDVIIRQNGKPMSRASDGGKIYYGISSTSVVLELAKNDVIDVFVKGRINGGVDGQIQFSGFLIG